MAAGGRPRSGRRRGMLSVAWRIALVGLLVLPPVAIGQNEEVESVPRLPWDAPDLQGIWLRSKKG